MLRDQDSEIVYRDFASSAMTQLARDLRQRETSAEDRLWSVLRNRRLARLKFRRQHPIAGTAYIVDFLCYAARLVVELDGGIHAEQVDDDDARQSVLEALGYKVIRFRNEDVFENLEVVLMTIMMAVQEMNEALLSDVALTPNPSPSGRGEP
jgi:very-short-patch-repair endonuclease